MLLFFFVSICSDTVYFISSSLNQLIIKNVAKLTLWTETWSTEEYDFHSAQQRKNIHLFYSDCTVQTQV